MARSFPVVLLVASTGPCFVASSALLAQGNETSTSTLTSTTTTFKAPTPAPSFACTWTAHANKYSGGYAGGVSTQYDLDAAKQACEALSACAAVTCNQQLCTMRASTSLRDSPGGETTYTKTCSQAPTALPTPAPTAAPTAAPTPAPSPAPTPEENTTTTLKAPAPEENTTTTVKVEEGEATTTTFFVPETDGASSFFFLRLEEQCHFARTCLLARTSSLMRQLGLQGKQCVVEFAWCIGCRPSIWALPEGIGGEVGYRPSGRCAACQGGASQTFPLRCEPLFWLTLIHSIRRRLRS